MRINRYVIQIGIVLALPFGEVIVPSSFSIGAHGLAQSTGETINVRVYQQAAPATVSIQTEEAIGSGSIIAPDGLILTAASIVQNAPTVTVILADGRELEAETVGFGEAGLNLAVLRIPNQTNLPTIPLADPGSVAVGQRTFAIGNPFGQFQGTLTRGIVSRIDQAQGLIQTDAAINPGDIGGPLLNGNGELIGVITAIFNRGQTVGSNGIGFAVSIREIAPFLVAVQEGRALQAAPNLFARNAQPITPNGVSINGALTLNSNVLPVDNSYFNAYTFEGRTGEQVVIKMTSREFDAFLILIAPNARDMIQDDDSGSGTDAEITAILPEDGTYIILANAYEPSVMGRYSLSLEIKNMLSQLLVNETTVVHENSKVFILEF